MSYEAGRAKSSHYGVPTTAETCQPGFMAGYRDGESARAASQQSYTPVTFPTPQQQERREVIPSAPSGPITLGSAVKGLAGTGVVLGFLYGFFVLNGQAALAVKWAFVGGAAGCVAGAGVWLLAVILRAAIWLLGWALKIAFVLFVGYLLLHNWLHVI